MVKDVTNKTLATYLGLCTEVYDLSKPGPPAAAYAFYRDYATKANGLILEPMCGTGRFLLPLLAEGFSIHGFDASKHMLKALHDKAKTKNLEPMVWQGFVEDLKRPDKYNLIFIPSGSLGLIMEHTAVKLALKNIYDHLNEDGIFLFEAETLQAVSEQGIWRSSVWPKPNGQKIIFSQLATMQGDICMILGKYELIEAGKIIHTEIEEYKIKIYQQDELFEILKAAGFKKISTIKAFAHSSSPSNQEESIVYECRK